MRNTFKLSTFVLKLMLFSFVATSFFLASVKTQAKSENEKMVQGHIRLSLWYVGLENKAAKKPVKEVASAPEELIQAMKKYDNQHRVDN